MTETKKRKMSAAQRRARKRKIRNRRIAMTVALVLVVALVSVGGTIAWLTDKTEAVTNTFTVGNIDIELDESDDLDLKMVPGHTITKDPKVTVVADSEDCWLFVKVEKSANLDNFISYTVASTWTALDTTNYPGVYYYNGTTVPQGTPISVLTNDQVTVKDTVTKTMMDDLGKDGATQPTLTFTAYACQKDSTIDTAAKAWAKINP